MNTTLKSTFKSTSVLGAAGLSLLTLAGAASAQITSHDPTTPTLAFSTVKSGVTNTTNAGIGLGFDGLTGGGKLQSAPDQSTAQSVYEAFKFDSSAAGTFNTIASGTTVQLAFYGLNRNQAANEPPFHIYYSLYAFDPNAAAGMVPVTGPNLLGKEQVVTLGQSQVPYFSNTFNLLAPITAGQQYVLGITTLDGDTQDYALAGTASLAQSGLLAADASIDETKYVTNVDDQGNPTGVLYNTVVSNTNNNYLGFALYTGSSPVPEASSVVSTAILLSLGAGLFAFKRRRAFAK